MTRSGLKIDIDRIDSDAFLLQLHGELTASSESELVDAWGRASTGGTSTLVLDFSDIDHLDGDGLVQLIRITIQAKERGQVLIAFGLSETHRRVFRMVELDGEIDVYGDEARAFAAVGVTPRPRPQPDRVATPIDSAHWAQHVSRVTAPKAPPGAKIANLEGRHITGPLAGFGRLWEKTYLIGLPSAEVTSAALISTWKAGFAKFWPPGDYFYASPKGIAPGEVAVINIAGPGGMPLATGVVVFHADDRSFSFITVEGHMFAGINAFSSFEEDGCTVAKVHVLVRTSDPLWEIAMGLYGYRKEDELWQYTLKSLAKHFVADGAVEMQVSRLSGRQQLSGLAGITRNAAIGSVIHAVTSPLRRSG